MPDTPYFTSAEFRAFFPNDAAVQALTDDQIDTARGTAEEIIEKACHVAFTPRTKVVTLSGSNGTRISVPLYKVREVTGATVDGVTVDVAKLSLADSSVYYSGWTQGFGNVALSVSHGYDAPPLEIKEAAMTLAKHRAIKGPIDDRAVGVPTDAGIITLATPGQRGSVTGLPSVDQAIQQYRLPAPTSVASVSMTDSGNLYPPDSWLVGWDGRW